MKYVIDTCSLVFLEKFYSKMEDGHKLKSFIQEKISSGELIIIDKVLIEIRSYRGNSDLMSYLGISRGTSTNSLLSSFFAKINPWYILNNERFYNNNQSRINAEKSRFQNRHADLWLIVYCLEVIKNGEDVMLITDENGNEQNNNKLYKKIPTICAMEGLQYKNIVQLLFDEYSNEITLSVS